MPPLRPINTPFNKDLSNHITKNKTHENNLW